MKEEDTFRILLATDNHLGYKEKDPIRREDSFTTFQEILDIAKKEEVDLVLLGGDLFHDNRPSRWAEKKCLDILRSSVLGDDPIKFEFLSDPKTNFGHSPFPRVNFEDPDLNVSLPIFTVHGNHDDPSGLGGYSVLDTLHSSGLLNYFGKYDDLSDISMSPILLRKGSTNLSLYGLSSIKDERLHKMFLRNQIRMLRPRSQEWFNLFIIHQNRSQHGPNTNYIPERFIDGCVDLVLWGHEHECRIEPETIVSGNKEIFVSQPGSSVATSLCESEAKEKKVAILSVIGNQFKIDPFPLKTVRPLVFKTISIDEESLKLKKGGRILGEKEIRLKVEEILCGYVEEMLIEADSQRSGHPAQPELPLLRLRVEISDDAYQLTPGRFGNLFHDRVANPSDILLFRKKKLGGLRGGGEKMNLSDFETEGVLKEGTSMKDFISQYFEEMEEKKKTLKLLGVRGIASAVESYIEKDQKDAIGLIVEKQLQATYESILNRMENEDQEGDIEGLLEEVSLSRGDNKTQDNEAAKMLLEGGVSKDTKDKEDDFFMSEDEQQIASEEKPKPIKTRGTRGSRGRGSRSTRGSTRGKQPTSSPIKNAFRRQSQRSSKASSSMYFEDSD